MLCGLEHTICLHTYRSFGKLVFPLYLGNNQVLQLQVLLLLSSPVFWFCLIMIPIITLLVDVMLKAARITISTSETDRIRQYADPFLATIFGPGEFSWSI